ncbi:hypothetical protein EJ05DRAFT_475205 [Pseudovirgaria hyperparasitica]|uniref:Protein kinase domain-containing protein n=1 Tax=Pseudovirgaria hyperparasitica TaxID=470096 RepID=A0A6A6W8T8_9PEZI|nr:uncharacterized protein EJ05DRAFT_475205 [Pseudovirgaria hyperparasitica]KAF2758965.1 hypothetical protein EJ05DRAFT_475205 [Pseudovirgaria hyperparasitica]
MPPPWNVISLLTHQLDCNARLTVLCRGRRVYISIRRSNLNSSPTLQRQLAHFLKAVAEEEDDNVITEDFYDWLLEPCKKLLGDLCFPSHLTRPTYADYLALETLHFELHSSDGHVVPVRSARDDIMMPPGIRLHCDLFSVWPVLGPEDLQIRLDSAGTDLRADSVEESLLHEPSKVYVMDHPYFFKAATQDNRSQCERELQVFKEIEQAGLKSLNITHLSAVVCDSDGVFYGFLLPYINTYGNTLTWAMVTRATASERARWAEQVTHIVERLHAAGIVWGDVKADNVLVDTERNAWVVDFGGGHTIGWGESSTAGTIEGDRIGLQKILEFIRSPKVVRE